MIRIKSIFILFAIFWVNLTYALDTLQDGAPQFAYLNPETIPNAIPKQEPLSEKGNPIYYEVLGQRYFILPTSKGYLKKGIASWYGTKFHGKRTSSGETYNMYEMTAANKSLPIPCYVRVTNLENGKKIIVKVNDRGPFHEERIIDLSYAAALKLDMLGKGTAAVEVEALAPHQYYVPLNPEGKAVQNLYLQLGAFGQLANANEFAKKVSQILKEKVVVFETKSEKGTLYRVNIGPLTNELHAIAVNDQLTVLGFSKGIPLYF